MKVSFPDRQLALNLDLFELWEVDRGAKGDGEGGAARLLLWGVCLPAFKGHSHLNGFLGLCSWVWFQRTQYCGILLPLGPPLTVWNGAFIPRCESSLPGEQCRFLAGTAMRMAFLSGVYCCCINLHLKLTIKCFWTCQTRIKIFCSIYAYV